jgi:hypothetical protein
MPPHDGRRLRDLEGSAPARPASREQHPKHSIGAPQAKPSARGLLKDGELVSQGKNFNLEFNARTEAGPKGGDDRNRDRAHARTRYQVRAVIPKSGQYRIYGRHRRDRSSTWSWCRNARLSTCRAALVHNDVRRIRRSDRRTGIGEKPIRRQWQHQSPQRVSDFQQGQIGTAPTLR